MTTTKCSCKATGCSAIRQNPLFGLEKARRHIQTGPRPRHGCSAQLAPLTRYFVRKNRRTGREQCDRRFSAPRWLWSQRNHYIRRPRLSIRRPRLFCPLFMGHGPFGPCRHALDASLRAYCLYAGVKESAGPRGRGLRRPANSGPGFLKMKSRMLPVIRIRGFGLVLRVSR